MLKLTAQLFLKALIIGLLINIVLHQVPVSTTSPTNHTSQTESRQSLEAPPVEMSSGFFE